MSSKTKSTSNSTMQYGQTAPTESPDIAAARTEANTDPGPDPSIQYGFARQKQAAARDLSNPFGPNYSPETAAAMKYSRENDIDTAHGQALQVDAFNRKQAKFQKLYALAGLTAPKTVQTSGSTTGTVSQPLWPGLLSSGISAGLSAAF